MPTLPRSYRVAAVFVLCVGFLQCVAALVEVWSILTTDRAHFVSSARDFYMSMLQHIRQTGVDSLSAPLRPPLRALLKLAPAQLEPLCLNLGSELYEQRNVDLPMAILRAILGYVLVRGALLAVRVRLGGVSALVWACMANIPPTLLQLLVHSVHMNRLQRSVGAQTAESLVKNAGLSPTEAASTIDMLAQLWTSSVTVVWAIWVLFLGVLTFLLQNRYKAIVRLPEPLDD